MKLILVKFFNFNFTLTALKESSKEKETEIENEMTEMFKYASDCRKKTRRKKLRI